MNNCNESVTPVRTINLVCRDESGREISHQGFAPEDSARADRIMIARNRAEINAGSTYRWGIETETPVEEATP
jgi:hypothetical protein